MNIRSGITIACLMAAAWPATAQVAEPIPAPAPAPAPAPLAVSPLYGLPPDLSDFTGYGLQDLQVRLKDVELYAQKSADGALLLQNNAMQIEFPFRAGGASGQYERGQNALSRSRWDEALEAFTEAAARGGNRADGALYWKAYTLNKMGRRDDALGALAELRKSHPSSRWLDDAKALELEVKQASGQRVSPESQSDEELKLMALNGLMQSNPERALPTLEGLLKSAQSPRLKERALFVLAQSSSPKAKQMLEQVARGAGNPDLQVKAIEYMGVTSRKAGGANQPADANAQLFTEIYNSTADVNVKRAVLNAFSTARQTDRLLAIAKTEKTPELRQEAVRRLTSARSGAPADALISLYTGEQDKAVKRTIVGALYSQDNVKGLVTVARAERDPEMVRYIVGRLANMKSPEAADYLMEILKK